MGKNCDILSVLQRICQTYPDHSAVVEDDVKTLTYQQLWRQSLRVAEYVKRQGGDCPFVGLNLPKSASYIVGMIGCWMAGKAFVPIGTDLPPARQSDIIHHADINLCLDAGIYDHAMSYPMSTTISPCLPHHKAYMIYSSGTTGTPKGILVSHAGLCNLAQCQQQGFAVDCHSRYLFFLSVNFDASISDILVTLTSGATLVIESMPQERVASSLFDVIENRQVTHTDIPPSLLRLMSPEHCPSCLQTIVIGGEPADIDTVRRWSRKVRLVNVYGPTEATVCTSMCRCDERWDAPLLGDVLDHTHYSVYADGKLDATEGELWISGIGLAIGYYKNEELTSKKFPVIDGVRYYRTADHVRMTKDNQLMFVGRIDRQVKYHGQLIELEEIEHTLRVNKKVRNVAVVKRKTGSANDKEAIVAFIQLMNKDIVQSDVERQLRQCCKHHLPRWMMPTFFVFVDHMPQTPSGKTDLHALSVMPMGRTVCEENHRYISEEEETIASMMADILKLQAMGPNDDFYLLGGDSLDTILLLSKLQQHHITITPAELRQASTPRQLARIQVRHRSMCIHSSQLEDQWQLSCSPAITTSVTTTKRPDVVLITGATGFLGSHLLSEIFRKLQPDRVICLVRCPSSAAGLERVRDTYHKYGLDLKYTARLEIVCGDISKPYLGLAEDAYKKLSEEVSAVYHCAASVNMLANYDQLKDANVIGTRNIIELCMRGRRKQLHFASTLSVFVSTDRNCGTAYENDHLTIPTNIYGGYGQTKYVAEKMVQAIDPLYCDVFIYRFGLLTGDTVRGISSPRDFLGMFFRGARTTGSLPYDKTDSMAVDITPINLASNIVTDIASKGIPGIYHIAAETPLYYNPLCSIMKEEGTISDIIGYEQWEKKVCTFSNNVDVQALRMALCRMDPFLFGEMRYMDLFQTTGIRFDMTNTHAATNKRCIQDQELIKLYIRQSNETL